MGMQLIDDIFEDNFSGWEGQHVKRYPVIPRRVPVKQIGLHPGSIPGVFDKKVIKIRMITNPFHNQVPITVKKQ